MHFAPPVLLPPFFPLDLRALPVDRTLADPLAGYLPFSAAELDSSANNNLKIIGDYLATEQHDRSRVIKIADVCVTFYEKLDGTQCGISQ